jgi:Zn-dependent peptidase ImmA (M78 family)
MPQSTVPITPDVVRWARERAGVTIEELADKVKVDPDVALGWETGGSQPTRGQFTSLVAFLKRPTALFFLPTAPSGVSEVPAQLRTGPAGASRNVPRKEDESQRWARRIQRLASWALKDAGEQPSKLPEFRGTTKPEDAAKIFRDLLGISVETQCQWTSSSEAFKSWRLALEGNGVLVLKLSMSLDGSRGFSIWDDYAPLAAVNSAFNPAVRVFTVLHEAGHLLLRSSAACSDGDIIGSTVSIEKWCERFAATVLMPANETTDLLATRRGISAAAPARIPEDARWLANRMHVSIRAAAARIVDLGLGAPGFYGKVNAAFGTSDLPSGGGGGGGQPRAQKRSGELGALATEVVIGAVDRARITSVDAAAYLKVKTGELDDLRRLGMAAERV